ncbi:MAG: ParB N-terminal domain-containing protein, partial [Salinisphaera sp.]|nr:ParB N-terminal domain-containing protein [Salinisphaera sp.]
LLQPITVAPTGEAIAGQNQYKVICGHRRLEAMRWRADEIGTETIPAIVRADLAQADVRALQIVENLQRVNLSLGEIVQGVGALCADRDNSEVARLLGRSRSWVSRRNKIANGVRADVRSAVLSGHISDVDIAHNLNALFDLDKTHAERLLARYVDPAGDYIPPPTREALRGIVEANRARQPSARDQQEESVQAPSAPAVLEEHSESRAAHQSAEATARYPMAEAEDAASARQATPCSTQSRRRQASRPATEPAPAEETNAEWFGVGGTILINQSRQRLDQMLGAGRTQIHRHPCMSPGDTAECRVVCRVRTQAELQQLVNLLDHHWRPDEIADPGPAHQQGRVA